MKATVGFKNAWRILAILSFNFFLFSSCNKDEETKIEKVYQVKSPENPVAKGTRTLGINVSENTNGWDASFNKSQEAGNQLIEQNITWNSIETSKGVYEEPYGGVFGLSQYYADRNTKVGISIALINTVAWELPSYLTKSEINSVEAIEAFNNMIDWVIDAYPSELEIAYLSVGNEVDLVLDGAEEWAKYTEFYAAVVKHMQANHPTIPVGVKTTIMGGIFGGELEEIQTINEHSDVVMLNYYPQGAGFRVLEPGIAREHLKTISGYFKDQTIYLTELGYQSGDNYCRSSEAKQAEFFHEFFKAWDTYKDQIEVVVIDWLHDQTTSTIEEWKDYYGDDPALVEYLSSLGLRNFDDTDKAAWKQLLTDTKARGW